MRNCLGGTGTGIEEKKDVIDFYDIVKNPSEAIKTFAINTNCKKAIIYNIEYSLSDAQNISIQPTTTNANRVIFDKVIQKIGADTFLRKTIISCNFVVGDSIKVVNSDYYYWGCFILFE